MFLRKRSVSGLDVFLSGFCFGLDMACPEGSPRGGVFRHFGEWLLERQYGSSPKPSQFEWLKLILVLENGDDEAAFARFFLLWDEFLAST
jgi:hypothetical protein